MATEPVQRTFGQKVKRFAIKGAVYLTLAYGAGAAIGYHLTNDKIKDQISASKTSQIENLVNSDTATYASNKKIQAGLEAGQNKTCLKEALAWPVYAFQKGTSLYDKVVQKSDTTTVKTN